MSILKEKIDKFLFKKKVNEVSSPGVKLDFDNRFVVKQTLKALNKWINQIENIQKLLKINHKNKQLNIDKKVFDAFDTITDQLEDVESAIELTMQDKGN